MNNEIIKINENTYRIEDNGVRFFLLEGNEKALLIDSGRETPDAMAIAESLTPLPLMLLNTHADPDHISGNDAFDEVFMSPDEEEYYRAKGGRNRVIPVRGGDEIDLGGRPLKVIDNPGHTRGSIALLDVRNRVLIGGDSIQSGNIYMFGAHRDMKKYAESLRKILAEKEGFDVIYPSHGEFPVFSDIIEKLIRGAEQIMNGEAEGERITLHGSEVLLYRFSFAGFYVALPSQT